MADKAHLNIVFIGHVDAGKSTLSGQILYLGGEVDERTLEKYKIEAAAQNRESWALSWAMDIDEGEREKGKTAECGRASFETANRTISIIDAPGHKNFVPRMIAGASQADVAILIVSARKGEYETGFEKGGQTREHAILVRTTGVSRIVIAVNKMDDPTVQWDEGRYTKIVTQITKFLRQLGFPKNAISSLPLSGVTGSNVRDRDDSCAWYKGPSLFEALDAVEIPKRESTGPMYMPILDKYKETGLVLLGKLQQGRLEKDATYTVTPGGFSVAVTEVGVEKYDRDFATAGDNVHIKIRTTDDHFDVHPGSVIHDSSLTIGVTREFIAKVSIMEAPDPKKLISVGSEFMIHLGAAEVRATVKVLMARLGPDGKAVTVTDMNGNRRPERISFITKPGVYVIRFETDMPLAMAPFETFQPLGRFCIREGDTTLGVGVVHKLA
ncbi:Elongation factor Tu GTP binding domain [Carpediemonas membranifera]|uniref:Elongation factor Tu GTP binding domain n=1 Tax=Carpediemonas membranifera TaxID=201153 RepID=A0A8J6EAJ3_9EUKA|nr:Elongation factor Tu GTP binding domain [Carpediemonas membranifera]|eukprot:KAG9394780.1 Elongation factor Tu GTP binding domain [Carpediemonas membranifera]